MEASHVTLTPPRPRGFHLTITARIVLCAVGIGFLAASDAILAAVVAGAFTLLNTALTVWLTGGGGGRKRKRKRETDE